MAYENYFTGINAAPIQLRLIAQTDIPTPPSTSAEDTENMTVNGSDKKITPPDAAITGTVN